MSTCIKSLMGDMISRMNDDPWGDVLTVQLDTDAATQLEIDKVIGDAIASVRIIEFIEPPRERVFPDPATAHPKYQPQPKRPRS